MRYDNLGYKHEIPVIGQMPWDLSVGDDVAEVVV